MIKEIAESVQARLVGDGSVQVSGIASIKTALAADLVFVEDAENLDLALKSAAAAVIAGEFAGQIAHAKPILVSVPAADSGGSPEPSALVIGPPSWAARHGIWRCKRLLALSSM